MRGVKRNVSERGSQTSRYSAHALEGFARPFDHPVEAGLSTIAEKSRASASARLGAEVSTYRALTPPVRGEAALSATAATAAHELERFELVFRLNKAEVSTKLELTEACNLLSMDLRAASETLGASAAPAAQTAEFV